VVGVGAGMSEIYSDQSFTFSNNKIKHVIITIPLKALKTPDDQGCKFLKSSIAG
jgi:hypothetical protein